MEVHVLKILKKKTTKILPFFIKSLLINEHLRAKFVKLFLYEMQVDSSKTNARNIAINEREKNNHTSAFLMALSIIFGIM